MSTLAETLGKLDWSKWVYGLFSAFIGGGAGAATAGVAANYAVPGGVSGAAQLKIMAASFVVTGVFNGLAYLHQQPLPAVTSKESRTLTVEPGGTVTATKTTETTTKPSEP
jgi:hypothetical protein